MNFSGYSGGLEWVGSWEGGCSLYSLFIFLLSTLPLLPILPILPLIPTLPQILILLTLHIYYTVLSNAYSCTHYIIMM